MIDRIERALAGRTKSFHDEVALHLEIALALEAAGIPYRHEVLIPGVGRIDFVISETVVVEVKAYGGSGMGPVRQLLRYLDNPKVTAGVLLTVKASSLPIRHYERPDGSLVPLHKIELWKNAL